MTVEALAGRRILVVEDESLIAMFVQTVLEDLGCVVLGPIGRLDEALAAADEQEMDLAILDVHVRGGTIEPVAERLLGRGIPFVLASGYGEWALSGALQGMPRLTKPFAQRDLESKVTAICVQLQQDGLGAAR